MTKRYIVNRAEKDAVLNLDGERRYLYFIKRVADWETVWGLSIDGWVLSATASGVSAFPLWSAREFAEECVGLPGWEGAKPQSMSIGTLLDELLPALEADSVEIAVFPSRDQKGIVVAPSRLRSDLQVELEKYLV